MVVKEFRRYHWENSNGKAAKYNLYRDSSLLGTGLKGRITDDTDIACVLSVSLDETSGLMGNLMLQGRGEIVGLSRAG